MRQCTHSNGNLKTMFVFTISGPIIYSSEFYCFQFFQNFSKFYTSFPEVFLKFSRNIKIFTALLHNITSKFVKKYSKIPVCFSKTELRLKCF